MKIDNLKAFYIFKYNFKNDWYLYTMCEINWKYSPKKTSLYLIVCIENFMWQLIYGLASLFFLFYYFLLLVKRIFLIAKDLYTNWF